MTRGEAGNVGYRFFQSWLDASPKRIQPMSSQAGSLPSSFSHVPQLPVNLSQNRLPGV